MSRCLSHNNWDCAICTTRTNIPEAPRSPAQPDAVELLRDVREVFTSGGKTHVGKDYVGDCQRCQIIARIDAFLAKASHG